MSATESVVACPFSVRLQTPLRDERQFVNDLLFLGVEEFADAVCHLPADSLNLFQISNVRGPDPLDIAEEGQKRRPACSANPWDPVEKRTQVFFFLHLPVVGDGKAVRLVSDPLEEKEGYGPAGEIDGVLAARKIDAVLPFSGRVQSASMAGRWKGGALFVRRWRQCIDRRAAR